MNGGKLAKNGAVLLLSGYVMTLVVCSALYFIRPDQISFYIFDVLWLLGLLAFPRYFLRMPRECYFSMAIFYAASFISILYCEIEGRPLDPVQALVELARFTQMAVVANFFFNCARADVVFERHLITPALISILIPLLGGLLLYAVAPEQAMTFNRYSGYLDNPNSLALYVVVSTSIFFALMRIGDFSRLVSLGLVAGFLVTAVYSLVQSGSNSGIFLFLFTIIISIVNSLRKAAFLSFVLLFAYTFTTPIVNVLLDLAQAWSGSDVTGLSRISRMLFSLIQGYGVNELGSYSYRVEVRDHLFEQQFQGALRVLVGLGIGQSKNLIFVMDGNSVTVHNFYLHIFVEFGLLGVFAFSFFVFVFLRRYMWNIDAVRLFSGFLIASIGTPILYLPFYWVPLFAAFAALTIRNGRLPTLGRSRP